MTQLNNLPENVTEKIFKFLCCEDRLNLGLVDKSRLSTFRSLRAWRFRDPLSREAFDRFINNIPVIHSLVVTLDKPDIHTILSLLDLKHLRYLTLRLQNPSLVTPRLRIRSTLSQLIWLDLTVIQKTGRTGDQQFACFSKYIISHIQSLRHLRLRFSHFLPSTLGRFFISLARYHPHLESLDLEPDESFKTDLQVLFTVLKHLRKVNLQYTCVVNAEADLSALARHCPLLEDISLQAQELRPETVNALFSSCKNLKKFKLVTQTSSQNTVIPASHSLEELCVSSPLFHGECIGPLLEYNPNLKVLNVEGAIIGPADVDSMTTEHRNLESLGLMHANLTDDSLIDLLVRCPNLKELDLRRTRITNRTLEFIQDKLSDLRYLCLIDCKGISQTEKSNFRNKIRIKILIL